MIDHDQDSRPFLTILTPQGRGAVAVVRVWGRGAVAVADAVFRPARGPGLARTEAGRLRLGRIGRGLGDEVVAVVIEEDPPVVEIQCHGGSAAVGLVVEALREAGAQLAEPAVWAELTGESSIRADALLDLTRAPTLRTAEILLEQTQGALDRELTRLIEEIRGPHHVALEHLDRLIARGQVGMRLTTGWRVVIAGRPNVGKSRLLNALAGYQRAIVDPTPGTTRDLVTALTAFDGWPVELVDTAGVRETDNAIERSGIDRTLRQTETADLVLKVLDRSEPLQVDDRTLMSGSGPALLLASKADLPPAWELCEAAAAASILAVSAERGDGLDRLLAAVIAALVPVTPEPGAGVPFRRAHLDRLERARAALEGGNHELAIRSIEPMLEHAQRVQS
ncbi:MAG: GTPase [Isosphaeraceae bacterium]